MSKQKSRKSILKRFKITKKGKILREASFARHLAANKTARRKRRLKKAKVLKGPIVKKLIKFLGVKK